MQLKENFQNLATYIHFYVLKKTFWLTPHLLSIAHIFQPITKKNTMQSRQNFQNLAIPVVMIDIRIIQSTEVHRSLYSESDTLRNRINYIGLQYNRNQGKRISQNKA